MLLTIKTDHWSIDRKQKKIDGQSNSGHFEVEKSVIFLSLFFRRLFLGTRYPLVPVSLSVSNRPMPLQMVKYNEKSIVNLMNKMIINHC